MQLLLIPAVTLSNDDHACHSPGICQHISIIGAVDEAVISIPVQYVCMPPNHKKHGIGKLILSLFFSTHHTCLAKCNECNIYIHVSCSPQKMFSKDIGGMTGVGTVVADQ